MSAAATRRRIAAGLAIAVLTASGAAAAADRAVPTALVQAEIVFRDLAEPGRAETIVRDSSIIPVDLPDAWIHRPERRVALAAYRLSFENTGSAPLWLYVPRVRSNAEFRLNGAMVWSGGNMSAPLARHAHSPFLFALPDALLRDGRNEIEIRVASNAGTNGGLSRVYLGSREALWSAYTQRHFLQQTSVFVTSGIIAATAFYILFIWFATRGRHRGYFFLALAGLVWAARNLNLVWSGGAGWSADEQWFVEVLSYLGHGVFFAFLGLFLLDEYVPRGSRLRRAMNWGIALFLIPGPFLFGYYRNPSPALTLWFAAAAPILLGMLVILLRNARRQASLGSWLFFAMFLLLLLLNAHDNLVLTGRLDFERVNLAHFGGLAFFLAVAHMLVLKYAEANLAVERQNLTLAERLRAQEVQLAANYAAIGKMERATAVLEERGRIMRDLHDGLGAQLLSAIHAVRRGDLAGAQVEQVLQDCLNDMRLVIEVSAPYCSQLGTAMGGVRYHLEQRLAAAGLRLVWQIGDISDQLDLGPTKTLQLVRILQEAVSNVLKHASASVVTVALAVDAGELRLAISDNGRGFSAPAERAAHGLANMRRRAADMGGTLQIETAAAGTTVEARIPLPAADAAQEALP